MTVAFKRGEEGCDRGWEQDKGGRCNRPWCQRGWAVSDGVSVPEVLEEVPLLRLNVMAEESRVCSTEHLFGEAVTFLSLSLIPAESTLVKCPHVFCLA